MFTVGNITLELELEYEETTQRKNESYRNLLRKKHFCKR